MSRLARLWLYDLAARKARIVLETPEHIEAPNWMPDGSALVVNGGGRLYRVPLAAPALELIDTGHATRLNNDHGVMPDGRRLVISNHDAQGRSTIYTLPAGGGAPVPLTDRVPSWWHGISPDGVLHAYTAVRDGRFGIYLMPDAGGPEQCLIESDHHYDGPDFSADGRHVWFNSDRSGSSELWRIGVDGRDLQQMTDDARVNWFPHPSPDGVHLVYLAYPQGTQGHPAGLEVELRLMPAEGGAPQVLLALHGGQGTINVPSWAPDGSRFAYVDYTRD